MLEFTKTKVLFEGVVLEEFERGVEPCPNTGDHLLLGDDEYIVTTLQYDFANMQIILHVLDY